MTDEYQQPNPVDPTGSEGADRPKNAGRERSEQRKAFEEVSKVVFGQQSLTAALQRVAELTKRVVPDVTEVSVTIVKHDQTPETVVYTGSLAYQLDQHQYAAGAGPCVDAARTGTTIRVSNAEAASPYPEFSSASLRAGVTHSLSVGMPIPQHVAGGLNLYANGNHPFDERAIELAETFAQYAAVGIANAALQISAASRVAEVQAAMRSRVVIEEAKGIVMAANRCSADEAFAILVSRSQTQNIKLRTIAQNIVDNRTSK